MALVLGFGELSLVSRAGFYPNLKIPPCSECLILVLGGREAYAD